MVRLAVQDSDFTLSKAKRRRGGPRADGTVNRTALDLVEADLVLSDEGEDIADGAARRGAVSAKQPESAPGLEEEDLELSDDD